LGRQANAASALGRLIHGGQADPAQPFQQALHDGQVHAAADHGGVLRGEGAERAVGQGQPGWIGPGGIPLIIENSPGRGQQFRARRAVCGLAQGRVGQPAAMLPGGAAERVGHGLRLAARIGDPARHELPGQLVAPLGHGDGEFPGGTAVELGGASGAWPPAPGAPRELDLEQAIVHELVEVELGPVPRHARPQALSLQLALRRLWSDHVIWTREYVVAAIANAPDAQAVAGRLLANQEHIGSAVVPFYGEQAGEALTGLLKQHIMVAVELIEAAKAADQDKFADADRRWDANARDIAAFLSSANPHWPEHDVADLLSQHLKLTKDEATARLQQRWEDDIEAFDQIFTEILTVADVLSAGIVKQFPDRF
jgi:hypothetical protein